MATAVKRARIESSSSTSSWSSSTRSLEITIISGEDLRINGKLSVKNSFAVIKIDSAASASSSYSDHRTTINKEGGSYPSWNEKLVVDMPMHARFITAEVQCKGNGGNRIIGIANIPVSDFIGGLVPENYLHFLSYRLRDTKGERNGIINLSVRVKNVGIGNDGNFASNVVPTGFMIQQQWSSAGVPMDTRFGCNQGQVVTGIPVRFPNF